MTRTGGQKRWNTLAGVALIIGLTRSARRESEREKTGQPAMIRRDKKPASSPIMALGLWGAEPPSLASLCGAGFIAIFWPSFFWIISRVVGQEGVYLHDSGIKTNTKFWPRSGEKTHAKRKVLCSFKMMRRKIKIQTFYNSKHKGVFLSKQ